jgi:uncharacterized protein
MRVKYFSLHISLLLSLALLSATHQVVAQPAPPPPVEASPKETYTKYEYRIPMRDGKRLFTAVFVPKDGAKNYPFLMTRTPYNVAPYGVDEYPQRLGPNTDFDRAGYIFVNQDVRGRHMSEGVFIEMTPHKVNKSATDVDESTDMFDTVEWLLKNVPNNNGRVGIWGNSYPGFFVSASIIDGHPAIKAASPQAPVTDLYMGDDSYHNGAFMLAANYGFYTFFKQHMAPTLPAKTFVPHDFSTKDGYAYFLKLGTLGNITATLASDAKSLFPDQVKHDTYDAYWQTRNIAAHLKGVKAAVLTVGGWFDAEDAQGPLSTYAAIKKLSPNASNTLVMGPWAHGRWNREDGAQLGHVQFRQKTGEHFRKNILLPFFEKHLKDVAPKSIANIAAHVFETGTNIWRTPSAWPPSEAIRRRMYLQAGGALAWVAPTGAENSFDTYVSDPAKPVPFINAISTGVPPDYMVGDQRFAATRPDVLVYRTETLEEDVTIAGPVSPMLFVSSTGTDSDFVVKLIDVYPDELNEEPSTSTTSAKDVQPARFVMAGYQQLVRGEPFRAKFRNSFITPEALRPNEVAKIKFDMPDVYHTFRRGHKIMVQIQSSWFPLVDLNPQKFVRILDAKATDFQSATQRVYRQGAQATYLEMGVIPKYSQ